MDNDFLTVSELSSYLHIKPATLYAKAGAGEIPSYKIGRLIRFKRKDVEDWLEGQRRDHAVDVERVAKTILRDTSRGPLNIDGMVKKTIEDLKLKVYTSDHGRPDQIKDLGKEVGNESVS